MYYSLVPVPCRLDNQWVVRIHRHKLFRAFREPSEHPPVLLRVRRGLERLLRADGLLLDKAADHLVRVARLLPEPDPGERGHHDPAVAVVPQPVIRHAQRHRGPPQTDNLRQRPGKRS